MTGSDDLTEDEAWAEWREYHRHGPRFFASNSGEQKGDPNPNHPLNHAPPLPGLFPVRRSGARNWERGSAQKREKNGEHSASVSELDLSERNGKRSAADPGEISHPDLDELIRTQLAADALESSSSTTGTFVVRSPPLLSDHAHSLRHLRTESLFEGYRRIKRQRTNSTGSAALTETSSSALDAPLSVVESSPIAEALRREIREIKARMRLQWRALDRQLQATLGPDRSALIPDDLLDGESPASGEDDLSESDPDQSTRTRVGDPPSTLKPHGRFDPPDDGGSDLLLLRSSTRALSDDCCELLVGTPFLDDHLGWCTITGWGGYAGTPILFYKTHGFSSSTEFFTSASDALSYFRESPGVGCLSFPSRAEGSDRNQQPSTKSAQMLRDLCKATDKYEAAIAMQPEAARPYRHPEPPRRLVLSLRQIRRVLASRETLFKFGIFVPKNDREANASPEAARWKAGRDLEWLRLNEQGTFDPAWSVSRMTSEYPLYQRCDIGHLFYVYDYKYSGEHCVRLVFDGSRQSASTYKETYAPTARQESVRLFHIVCVEESWGLGQYDVPQAFLKALIDHVIFAYPPKGQAAYPGQILLLKRALYGGKQSAYLWFTLINEFVLSLGFVASPLDSCLYRREDAILILFCDDLRIGATDVVLMSLYRSFYEKFRITTASGDRFLGMDTFYDRSLGIMKISMESYIDNTVERFSNFDLSRCLPYREIVGCLLWISLCVMGPELLRVKDFARRSNTYTEDDYSDAFAVLRRVALRREHGIIIRRGAAGTEIVPSNSRSPVSASPDDTGMIITDDQNELRYQLLSNARRITADPLYTVADPDGIDIPMVSLPVNPRYSLVAYGDASFATGQSKQSVSGYIIYVNGVPLLWGSLKQKVIVDSSCSAEFVAASIVCKQIQHAENMVAFLGFTCPKPYRLYTDSSACFHIATNPSRLGNVRHLEIRYHLVRCFVTLGTVEMIFCVTEEMVADLFTKLVVLAQDTRLTVRFYTLLADSASMALSNTFKQV
jgi:hypothetical protein